MADVLILIPARMAATRLPGKPLADIAGEPMIVHVLRRAQAADARPGGRGDRFAGDRGRCATRPGGRAVMTRADHASGSDRIFEALGKADPDRRAKFVVNVQGDLPTLDPTAIAAALRAARRSTAVDIATLAAEIKARRGARRSQRGQGGRHAGRARRGCARSTLPAPPRPPATGRSTITSGFTPIAARRWSASSTLPPSPLEQREKLEQLRALEAGMRIDVAIVDTVPLGVDTPEDLEKARSLAP